jgi:hypothetical protein
MSIRVVSRKPRSAGAAMFGCSKRMAAPARAKTR